MLPISQAPLHTTDAHLRLSDRYHVTVLSNFARGFDKYDRTYSKQKIQESKFPDQFHVLTLASLSIGLQKNDKLLSRLSIPGNCLIVLKTEIQESHLNPNTDTGLGELIDESFILVSNIFFLTDTNALKEVTIEEAMSLSLALVLGRDFDFNTLTPRSISILPIASGCQARCQFCFSKASVSVEQRNATLDIHTIRTSLVKARDSGAERAVITGGGEPTLYPKDDLLKIIRLAADYFPKKVVLITNGYVLAQLPEPQRVSLLQDMQAHGLTTIAFSHHHWQPEINQSIMNLMIDLTAVLRQFASHSGLHSLRPRLICVLQKNGVATSDDIHRYLLWAASIGVKEVCFKELYVSTSQESVYYTKNSNEWSLENQIPLRHLLDYFIHNNWSKVATLPWGAPIYEGSVGAYQMRVAAYTEPSLFWELSHGICRSWNVMADGKCLASLEDKRSEVNLS